MTMKTRILIIVGSIVLLAACKNEQKPVLRQGAFYTEEQGAAELKKLESMYSTSEQWEPRKKMLKERILKGMNLSPLPTRTPLNAITGTKRIHDGYTVENVSIETIPGFYLCGNLYRPLDNSSKHPGILCPHGHFEGDTLGAWGRFHPDLQKRCATFARMGAVVFSYSMFGWGGESSKQLDPSSIVEKPVTDSIAKYHSVPLALTMQTWNSMRVLDYLETLPDVDMAKIGVTGASGGGTQTFLLTALDDRVAVSVPVVMVSCHFFGGCNCESGLPIHQGADYFTNNAEIAAMAAPKPMLMVSDGADWTKNEPTVEYPFIKRTYSFYKAENNVENANFPDGVHDYGYAKRIPVYKFMAKHLGLNLQAVSDPDGTINENKSDAENALLMLSFTSQNPHPANALQGSAAIDEALKKLQK
ncbi:MAG: acetylxylan esterase [Bacteroidales bacterium]|nr:acetylxylan esterase [Bacteroidales bacterium]